MTVRQVPPNINDPNLRGFLNELRTALGNAADQISRLTGDVLRLGGGGGGGGGGNPPPDPFGPDKPPVGDGLPPPAPTSLQAVPGAFSITLVWTNPVIPDLAATEVWAQRSFSAWDATFEYLANAKVLVNGVVYRSRKAQDVNPTTNVVTLNKGFNPPSSPDWWQATTLNATEPSKVGESAGLSWIHDGLTPGETWAYWVRNRDIENLFSTFFPPDNTGIIATTTLDPGAYLDLLTNSITATQLYRDLGQRINLIDGPLTIQPSCSIAGHTTEAACKAAGGTWNPGSVAYRVAEEAAARASGLAAEALARETGITNEATIRQTKDEQLASTISIVNAKADSAAAAVVSEQTARVNADGALGTRIDAVVATTNGNTAAITSEATARANADSALGTRIDSVVTTTNNNTAAIQTEINARTTADSALSSRIDTVVAKTDTNTAAITSEATARANADGALGQRIDQVQAVGNNNSALITDINQSKIGYSTRNDNNQVWDANGTIKDKATADAWNAGANNTPKVTWNVGIPLATAVKQVSVTGPAGTVALEQQFIAQQTVNDNLYAQYTVKIDNQGWVSGFGLASEVATDGSPRSDFGVRADRFWIAAPANNTRPENLGAGLNTLGSPQLVVRTGQFRLAVNAEYAWYAIVQVADVSGLAVNQFMTLKNIRATATTTTSDNYHPTYNGSFLVAAVGQNIVYGSGNAAVNLLDSGATVASRIVIFRTDANLGQGFTTSQTSGQYSDPARLISSKNLPFIVTTTSRTYNGVQIDPGVYMNAAFIVDASITNAKIFGHICSDNFEAGGGNVNNPHITPGLAGWCINKNGNTALNNAAISGSMRSTVAGSPTLNWDTGQITNYGTAGWAIGKNGDAVFNTVMVRTKNIEANAVTEFISRGNNSWSGYFGPGSYILTTINLPAVGRSRGPITIIASLEVDCVDTAGEYVELSIYGNGASATSALWYQGTVQTNNGAFTIDPYVVKSLAGSMIDTSTASEARSYNVVLTPTLSSVRWKGTIMLFEAKR